MIPEFENLHKILIIINDIETNISHYKIYF